MGFRRSLLSAAVPFLFLAPLAAAQTDYALSFEPGGARWQVEVRLAGRGEDALDFRFPLWTPGAYHVSDYGRFVKELTAADEKGAPLSVERVDEGHFELGGAAAAKEIVIRYSAVSMSSGQFTNNVIDVESNRIAAGYAYVNPPSLFGFVPARAAEPVRLALTLPEGWQVATVLARDAEGRFTAPSYLRFEDSPLLFSPSLQTASFTVDGKPHTVSVHGRSAEDTKSITAGCQRIVEAGSKLMLGLPYERYHFLYGFVPEAVGSGLEHSDSTLILLAPGTGIGEDEHMFWGITAHEFFHLWCAERIHVQEIRAPDLLEPLETGTIWVNEGITEYFCRHLLLQAGFYDEEELLASYLEGAGMEGAAGSSSWADVSREAADWNGMGDLMTFALRMYVLGPRVVFALDMEMRRETEGERGVLDLLRYLMENYDAKGRGFGEEELDDVLSKLAGPAAADFHARCIEGSEIPDPEDYLDVLGYRAENGKVVSLEPPSEAQLRARSDYFSATGKP
jgi:predicted metalloprotease with PDZ domain